MPNIRTLRWRALAALVLAVLAGTGIAVSWLHEQVPEARGPVVQEHHDPGTCVPLHDHGICVQHQHARWLPVTPASVFGAARLVWLAVPVLERHHFGSAVEPGLLPRAPPLS